MPISKQELGWVKPYSHNFVECGSAGGNGIQAALDAGFESIYSVDINPQCTAECKERFKSFSNVALTNGDCGEWLEAILNYLAEPCVIYLDANGWAHEKESPYHASIASLRRHGRQDHFVIVDDMNMENASRAEMMRDIRRSLHTGSDQDVIRQLASVNPNYNLYLEDSHSVDFVHTYPSWILIGSPIALPLNKI